jgi:hypothetical protein
VGNKDEHILSEIQENACNRKMVRTMVVVRADIHAQGTMVVVKDNSHA